MNIKLFENFNIDNAIIETMYNRATNNKGDLTDIYDKEFFLEDEYAITINDGLISFDYLDEDIKNIIGKYPVVLYHFAPKKFEDSIKTKGLQSNITKTNIHDNSYSGIYLTTRTSGKEIDGYKYHIRNTHDSDVILVTVKKFLNEIESDPDDSDIISGNYQFITNQVKPERILEIEDTH